MKKIKKTLLVVSLFLFVFLLVGCGVPKVDKNDSGDSNTSTEPSTQEECKVIFTDNFGNELERKIIKKGSLVSEPSKPYKDGYEFKGWFLNGSLFDFNYTRIHEDTTIVGIFEQIPPRQVLVNYFYNYGAKKDNCYYVIITSRKNTIDYMEFKYDYVKDNFIIEAWKKEGGLDFYNTITFDGTIKNYCEVGFSIHQNQFNQRIVYYVKYNCESTYDTLTSITNYQVVSNELSANLVDAAVNISATMALDSFTDYMNYINNKKLPRLF